MKNKPLLILFILIFSVYCHGQNILPFSQKQSNDKHRNFEPIVDTSKIWSVYQQYAYVHYSLYFKIGDTITLNGIIYRKVFETNDSLLSTWTFDGYIRENENSEVFFRKTNGDEGLIYKFNLLVNDTVVVYNPLVCPEYNTLVVSEIDSVWLGNIFRKRIHFFNSNNEDYWIEGIGSRFGLLFSNYCYIGTLYNLICYYESDNLIYQNPDFTSCYYPLVDNVSKNETSELFQVKYSTSDQTIVIHSSNVNTSYIPFTLRIYNLLGNEVLNYNLFNDSQIISTSHFVKGLYLVSIISHGNLFYQNKILIY